VKLIELRWTGKVHERFQGIQKFIEPVSGIIVTNRVAAFGLLFGRYGAKMCNCLCAIVFSIYFSQFHQQIAPLDAL